jgi:hypothetical protein
VRGKVLLGSKKQIWGLDRKFFRALVARLLPPGHSVMDIRTRRRSERSSYAARAFERLRREAANHVPALPEEFEAEDCIVWSSLVLRPRSLETPVVDFLRVNRGQVPTAIGELWSNLYLDSSLEGYPEDARRVEMGVGVCAYEPELGLELETQKKKPTRGHADRLPSLARIDLPLTPLEADLLRELSQAYVVELDRRGLSISESQFVERGPGTMALGASVVAHLAHQAPKLSPAFELCFGSGTSQPPENSKQRRSLPQGLTKGSQLLLLAREAERLSKVVQHFEESTSSSQAWFSELDLGVLPDDGLCTTLLELREKWRLGCRIAAHAELLAALHIAHYQALTGLPLFAVDGGLPLPLHRVLEDFEDAMTRVRPDTPLTEALARKAALPDGPGRRALLRFVDVHGALWGTLGLAHPRLLEGVSSALVSDVSVTTKLSQAAAEADRLVARFEESTFRVAAAVIAPLRAQTRAVVALRERARHAEVLISSLLARTLEDAGRRLSDLEPGLSEGSLYFATLDELIRILDLRGENISARVFARRTDLELSSAESGGHEFFGLGARRLLDGILSLVYRSSKMSYDGRPTDSVPTLARTLAIQLG